MKAKKHNDIYRTMKVIKRAGDKIVYKLIFENQDGVIVYQTNHTTNKMLSPWFDKESVRTRMSEDECPLYYK